MAAKIWVVDDEEGVRKVLEAMLKKLGYEVRLFDKAEDAVIAYGQERPDAIITDMRMPGMNGMDLTRNILEKDRNAIIMILTGYPSIPEAVEAIQMGAVDFLSKPCRMEEIRLRVERALENKLIQKRLKKTRFIAWTLVETLPLWIILGMLLARLIK